MPIFETPPPAAAVQAFRAGLSWLAESEERLRDLHQVESSPFGPVPPPHIMEVWTLDGAILDRENFRRAWRFFVSGQHIPLGVVEVAPAGEWAGTAEYEFLAFREGPSIVATARTFARANEFTSHQAEMGLTFLKLPALGATFLWLQDLETDRPRLKWTHRDWLLAIPPAARGFPADEPEPMPPCSGIAEKRSGSNRQHGICPPPERGAPRIWGRTPSVPGGARHSCGEV